VEAAPTTRVRTPETAPTTSTMTQTVRPTVLMRAVPRLWSALKVLSQVRRETKGIKARKETKVRRAIRESRALTV